jgi:DNA modification methylase
MSNRGHLHRITAKTDDGLLVCGDAESALSYLTPDSVQACITSPPYWQLRDYEAGGQIGREPSIHEYIERLLRVFREVRRMLTDDGVLWINLGDTYVNKQLSGVPWRVALALQDDRWRLRSDVIWAKPNPMPESVADRPVMAHEYVFLFSKSEHYFYDRDAIAEPAVAQNPHDMGGGGMDVPGQSPQARRAVKRRSVRPGVDVDGGAGQCQGEVTWTDGKRNARSVWTIPTKPSPWGHFATFPYGLPARCIEATTRPGDTVLDPFCGVGTTLAAAQDRGRKWIGVDINDSFAAIAAERVAQMSLSREEAAS